MQSGTIIPDDKKLTILFRLEPGCLGPNGTTRIEAFCNMAIRKLRATEVGCINWAIQPRYDKTLPEIQYFINNKKLDDNKVEKYLALFDSDKNIIENNLQERISVLIEEYMTSHN